jgi:opacity protein-like surface antigen
MKRLLALASALGALGNPAIAADIPLKAPVAVVSPSWSGLYLGADIGIGLMRSIEYSFADPGNAAFFSCGPCVVAYSSPNLTSGSKTGWLGGVRFGYNWQTAAAWLVGVETDFLLSSFKASASGRLNSGTFTPVTGSSLTFETTIKWLASLRGRVGVIRHDWLFYLTGGVAFADIRAESIQLDLYPA